MPRRCKTSDVRKSLTAACSLPRRGTNGEGVLHQRPQEMTIAVREAEPESGFELRSS